MRLEPHILPAQQSQPLRSQLTIDAARSRDNGTNSYTFGKAKDAVRNYFERLLLRREGLAVFFYAIEVRAGEAVEEVDVGVYFVGFGGKVFFAESVHAVMMCLGGMEA